MGETDDTKAVAGTTSHNVASSNSSPNNSESSRSPEAEQVQYELKKAETLALILAIMAVICTLTTFSLTPSYSKPFYFGQIVTILPGTIVSSFNYGLLPGLAYILQYAAPILLVVLMWLQDKRHRWLVMVPLAIPLACHPILLIQAIASREFLAILPSNLNDSLSLIFIYAVTTAIASVCALSRHPKKVALIGFGAVISLSTILLLFAQPPFGYTSESYYKVFFISKYLSFVFMVSSVAVFVVASDDHGLVPLLETKQNANNHNGVAATLIAPNPAERLDGLICLSNDTSPDPASLNPTSQPSNSDPYNELYKLKGLLDDGVINPEEYEAKKKQLLEKIGS